MDSSDHDLRGAFHARLREAVTRVRAHTRLGTESIVKDIQELGAVEAARRRIVGPRADWSGMSLKEMLDAFDSIQDSRYDDAAYRAGLPELSVEAIVRETQWKSLFTENELRKAAAGSASRETPAPVSDSLGTPLFRRLSLPWRGESSQGELDCAAIKRLAEALDSGRRFFARFEVRQHLMGCRRCGATYRNLVDAYSVFDEDAATAASDLVFNFASSLNFENKNLRRLCLWSGESDSAADLEYELHQIRLACAWRAVRLGWFLGAFKIGLAATLGAGGDHWVRGPGREAVMAFGQPKLLDFIVMAMQLYVMLDLRHEEEFELWLPSDGDLKPIPGLLHLESTTDYEVDWYTVMGAPLAGVDPLVLLRVALQSASFHTLERETVRGSNAEVLARLERIERAQRESGEQMESAIREQGEKLDTLISQSERIVAHMDSTSRAACEQSLHECLSAEVYGRLTPDARVNLLAAEQMLRVPDIASPSAIVHHLATAFELQLKAGVLPGIFAFLRSRNCPSLLPDKSWDDCDRSRPIWAQKDRADKYTLGSTRLLLRLQHPLISELLILMGLNREDLLAAIEEIVPRRNAAAHGDNMPLALADQIRHDWYQWRGRPGGVYSVLFRATPA